MEDMMIGSILTHWKTMWETWNIRFILLLSLSLQVILILSSPFRKRSAHTLLIFTIWSAYLLADWAAAFAVGHISVQQKYEKSSSIDNGALLAFWAPFLLVHLGGPDTITAFALEDNALWLRHLLNLIVQLLAAIYIFNLTLTKNKLLIPTLLMLVAGVIKYGERIRALYLASLKRFKKSMRRKPDAGLNYAKLMDAYSSLKEAMLPAGIELVPGPNKESKMTDDEFKEGELDEKDVVQYGYDFFQYFKGLIVDLTFTFQDHHRSKEFFRKRTAADALKVISIELNFMYEILYTKVLVVHSWWGYFFRIIASSMVFVTLVLFTCMKKHQYHVFDLMVTYALLYGAIALDAIAILMLIISDWTVVYAIEKTSNQKKTPILTKFLAKYVSFITSWNKPDFATCHIESTIKSKGRPGTQILKKFQITRCISFVTGNNESSSSECNDTNTLVRYQVFKTKTWSRRWSESICAYNLLSVCLKLRPQKILKDEQKGHWRTVLVIIASILLVIPGAVVLCFYLIGWLILTCSKRFSTGLKAWDTFVSSVAEKWDTIVSSIAETLGFDEALDSRKNVSTNPFLTKLWDFIYDELQVKSMFAGDIKTTKEIYEAKGEWVLQDGEWLNDNNPEKIMEYVEGDYDRILLLWHIATELCYNTEKGPNTENYPREFSKILSDYMLYLLIKQPTMMSNVAGISYLRFQDTCAEANKFLERRGAVENDKLKDACVKILGVDTSGKPLELNGYRCKSVLFDGCRLAKELKKRKDMWEMMSRVWVELLSYAAGHCRAEAHAQVLSKGGQLVTLVWLLMTHLGIVEQFQINDGHARAKLLLDA